jgi:prepilin-type N-terminal cleavage/methylation domain-containing protein
MRNVRPISFEDSKEQIAAMDRRNAFTLIELLVVIAIIALLMSILMPALGRAKAQARSAVCQSNLHQWGVVCKMYTGENKGQMPHLMDFDWITPMYQYYENINLLRCPSASKPEYDAGLYQELPGGKSNAWVNWWDYNQDGQLEIVIGSYGINMFIGEHAKDERNDSLLWHTTIVKGAAYIPVLTDSARDEDTPRTIDAPPEYDGQIYTTPPRNINEMRDRCIDRHLRCINVLFDDWHVGKVTLKRLWRLRWHREWATRIRYNGMPLEWNNPNHWMYPYPDE